MVVEAVEAMMARMEGRDRGGEAASGSGFIDDALMDIARPTGVGGWRQLTWSI